MDGESKYRQRGYHESDRDQYQGHDGGRRDERPRPQGPRPPIDVTGPRLPRLVQAVTASRCFNCSTALAPDIDFRGNCPKCGVALHCCKQCAYFEPSTRFQCLKPIPVRIAPKDQANECTLFQAARHRGARFRGRSRSCAGRSARMETRCTRRFRATRATRARRSTIFLRSYNLRARSAAGRGTVKFTAESP